MSTLLRVLVLAAAAFVCTAPGAVAQDAGDGAAQDTVYHLVLADGSSFNGYIESRTADRLVFRTLGGARLEVDAAQIRRLEPTEGRVVDGQVWDKDPNGTRLFFGPTGRSMEAGEGYVGLFELVFAFGAFSVGDRVVLAGGTVVLPEAFGEVLYFAPKVRAFSTDRLDVSVGAISFFATREVDSGSVGILYGVGTWGDPDAAVTAGAGWGFLLGDGTSNIAEEPVLLLGGERRVSQRVKLITENYVFAGERLGLLSGGVRLIGDRFSADLGLGAGFYDSAVECCLPVLSAVYTF